MLQWLCVEVEFLQVEILNMSIEDLNIHEKIHQNFNCLVDFTIILYQCEGFPLIGIVCAVSPGSDSDSEFEGSGGWAISISEAALIMSRTQKMKGKKLQKKRWNEVKGCH
jgi:hypothetical protein